MNKSATPIVVVAYNRPKSLRRILRSLMSAHYPSTEIDLIISIDNAPDNNDVLEIANNFEWRFGEKIVKYAVDNMGLRKHIISCASLALDYGSVIVLEDDLFVAPCFYSYTIQALNFSKEKSYIGGVSLYNHRVNVHNNKMFEPTYDPFDNYYFQFASSWGQAWSKTHVEEFLEWYESNQDITNQNVIPANVRAWSEKSWLKYFITFLIAKNKFFIYPKTSLSTNFEDAGTHARSDSTARQVPLLNSFEKKFDFADIEKSGCVYDSFFENVKLHKNLVLQKEDLTVDLYGYQVNIKTRFLLTTQVRNFKILKTFGRSLKPIDNNIIFNIEGDDIFLYDTTVNSKNLVKKDRFRDLFYEIKYVSQPNSALLFFSLTKKRIKDIYKRLTR